MILRPTLVASLLLTAFAAAGNPGLAGALGEAFDPHLVALVVVGVGWGLAGGVARALMPWGQSSWGFRDGLKAVVLGSLVGAGAAVALAHHLFDFFGDGGRWASYAVAGYLASRLLEQIDKLGPQGIFAWLARRGAAEPPPGDFSKEKDAP